ncbi:MULTISPECIES: hypothetical protein [unclassified Bradyrhizobium]|uniref:hypothetical protein n=1 Tax=unclassified Bradyrhizobium TaxID=2631580 RepID=UPI0028EC538F|nr:MULTISPECIES: hypothetical protein [unclassified Bradyrhizobium]
MELAWSVGFVTLRSDIERRQPERARRRHGKRRLISRLVEAPCEVVLTVSTTPDVQFLCAAEVAKLTLSPSSRCTFDHGDSLSGIKATSRRQITARHGARCRAAHSVVSFSADRVCYFALLRDDPTIVSSQIFIGLGGVHHHERNRLGTKCKREPVDRSTISRDLSRARGRMGSPAAGARRHLAATLVFGREAPPHYAAMPS